MSTGNVQPVPLIGGTSIPTGVTLAIPVSIANGGTGATSAAGALANLGAASAGSALTGFTNILNTGLGIAAGDSITTGTDNVLIGNNAGTAITMAVRNTAVGIDALMSEDVQANNTAVGYWALRAFNSPSGGNNTAVGSYSLYQDTVGVNNTAIGTYALQGIVAGGNNVAVGQGSGASLSGTGANGNVVVGSDALGAAINVQGNTAVGDSALIISTVGELTAVGSSAMYNNATGLRNTAIGYLASQLNMTGSDNTSVGHLAAKGPGSGGIIHNNNTAIGSQALTAVTTGSSNTAIGSLAGDIVSTGNENTLLGHNADVNSATAANRTVIGSGAVGAADNSVSVGNTSVILHSLNGTGSVHVPTGTTAQRNVSPANGYIRYNSTLGTFEGYKAGAWSAIGGGWSFITGGRVVVSSTFYSLPSAEGYKTFSPAALVGKSAALLSISHGLFTVDAVTAGGVFGEADVVSQFFHPTDNAIRYGDAKQWAFFRTAAASSAHPQGDGASQTIAVPVVDGTIRFYLFATLYNGPTTVSFRQDIELLAVM